MTFLEHRSIILGLCK